MARSKNGQAISESRRSVDERMKLAVFLEEARAKGDLKTWRRAKAMTDYISGSRVVELCKQLDLARSTINTLLRAYETRGVDALKIRTAPGAKSRLTEEQKTALSKVVTDGPQAAGYTSGVWTGPMVKDYVLKHFSVEYHSQHLPRLLHQLGFSLQRPRKLLARADAEAQRIWREDRLPAIKKK